MKAAAKRYLSIVAASFAALAATPASASKPVFLVGDPGELELVKADVSRMQGVGQHARHTLHHHLIGGL